MHSKRCGQSYTENPGEIYSGERQYSNICRIGVKYTHPMTTNRRRHLWCGTTSKAVPRADAEFFWANGLGLQCVAVDERCVQILPSTWASYFVYLFGRGFCYVCINGFSFRISLQNFTKESAGFVTPILQDWKPWESMAVPLHFLL